MRALVIAFIMLQVWPYEAMAESREYIKVKSLVELKVDSMADSTITTTLTTLTGTSPFKAVAKLMSSTGAYSLTSSTTSTVGVTVAQFTDVQLGYHADGVWHPREIHTSQFTGDWLFRFWYR
jgi:hypothetical protein